MSHRLIKIVVLIYKKPISNIMIEKCKEQLSWRHKYSKTAKAIRSYNPAAFRMKVTITESKQNENAENCVPDEGTR